MIENNPHRETLEAAEHSAGVFHSGLHLPQEGYSFSAIYEPVVVSEGDVHHRSYYNLPKKEFNGKFSSQKCNAEQRKWLFTQN